MFEKKSLSIPESVLEQIHVRRGAELSNDDWVGGEGFSPFVVGQLERYWLLLDEELAIVYTKLEPEDVSALIDLYGDVVSDLKMMGIVSRRLNDDLGDLAKANKIRHVDVDKFISRVSALSCPERIALMDIISSNCANKKKRDNLLKKFK